MSMSRAVGSAVATGLAALSLCSVASAQQPIKEGDTLTGKLRLVATRHPNGTKIEAYQIVSAPRMMPPMTISATTPRAPPRSICSR